eukprot:TRINITY_DN9521_c0_g1_i1.p1 TRINITY_DN9521_c0_g1~~TRINITY_DN9521_c0_g1_i1.p1  ORF type:complete len:153 (-),score=4.51 TRINITY_DN9521_c0_g1_i1:77-535(-)
MQSILRELNFFNKMSVRSARTVKNRMSIRNCSTTSGGAQKSFWQRWIAERPQNYSRFSARWWYEMTLICVIFAITGSSTMLFVKPVLNNLLQMEGSLKEGPWSYRIAYVGIITPIYSVVLLTVGTIMGRHHYFKKVSLRIWSRFIPALKKYQ